MAVVSKAGLGLSAEVHDAIAGFVWHDLVAFTAYFGTKNGPPEQWADWYRQPHNRDDGGGTGPGACSSSQEFERSSKRVAGCMN